jgi:hypothetical protein
MKIIVTHMSPDLDAIGSVWVIKKYLPGWSDAEVKFVPAGNRLERVKNNPEFEEKAILSVDKDEIMHVDTGRGPLDHHQTADQSTCGASRCWEFVQTELQRLKQPLKEEHIAATNKIIQVIVDYDHFQEVFRPEADADYQDFSFWAINEGLQYLKPGEDDYYVEYGRTCLEYLLSFFINKVWSESEMQKGVEFETRYGKGMGIETINTSVIKFAQKRGYVIVFVKDPRRGHVSIKTLPNHARGSEETEKVRKGIDLTLAYEQLKKMDTEASWYLHVSKKMLLNGSTKNPDMKPTTLTLDEIIKVLKGLYS